MFLTVEAQIARLFFKMLTAVIIPVTLFTQTTDMREIEVKRIIGVEYPRLANLARIQGTVTLVAEISETGSLRHVQVVSGDELLVGPIEQALAGWKPEDDIRERR